MKSVIEGKRYDTETATKVAEVSDNYGGRDFRAWSGTIYRTPRGNWFIEGSGGPMTMFAERVGDNTGSGSGIRALDKSSVRDLLERYARLSDWEQYQEELGVVEA